MLKADTHEGFWSRATLREPSSSVCTIDLMDVIHSWEQNVHPENNLVLWSNYFKRTKEITAGQGGRSSENEIALKNAPQH